MMFKRKKNATKEQQLPNTGMTTRGSQASVLYGGQQICWQEYEGIITAWDRQTRGKVCNNRHVRQVPTHLFQDGTQTIQDCIMVATILLCVVHGSLEFNLAQSLIANSCLSWGLTMQKGRGVSCFDEGGTHFDASPCPPYGCTHGLVKQCLLSCHFYWLLLRPSRKSSMDQQSSEYCQDSKLLHLFNQHSLRDSSPEIIL